MSSVNHDLLPEALRHTLPGLGSQRSLPEPMVYAHYHVPDRAWAYYVTEGATVGKDYELFGFLFASEHDKDWHWQSLRVSTLERMVGILRNRDFVPGCLTAVVVLPRE